MSDELVTIRVPKDLKRRMRMSKLNWSQELRTAIEQKLAADHRKRAARELDAILVSIKPGFESGRAIKETRRFG
jgi:post-segregation antitoxin (ccd killing protein)